MPSPIDRESPVRYVAIGDSFTEGVGDEGPDGAPRGWADRVASGLATGLGGPIEYANLAVRGRLLGPIIAEQLEVALALEPKPTLLSLNGGGNDMMRPGADLARLVELTTDAIHRCAAAGVPLLLLSGADPSAGLPFGAKIHDRGRQLTAAIARLVEREEAETPEAAASGSVLVGSGLTFVDAFNDKELRRPQYWSPDRLHLATIGHTRVAGLVLTALGVPVPDTIAPALAATRGPLNEAKYYRQHVLPWVVRRIRGRSSGDGRPAKHPGWITVTT